MTVKNLYIKTYGCQMNVYDSQRMGEAMVPLGFTLVEESGCADVIILNTCHIRAKAEDKLFSDLGRMKKIKEQRKAIIIVAGCVAQALGPEILKKAPYVDMVVGPQTYHTLPETVIRLQWERDRNNKVAPSLALGFPKMEKFDELPHERGLKGVQAFLSIQEGCNKFCRYCCVPFTRGPEYSRPVEDIINEAKQLLAKGAREITLLGQNVNAYHGLDKEGTIWSLGKLLFALSDLPGLYRLRYTTSHPRDVKEDLIAAHRDLPSVMPFLHLPVQSGSDKILAHMNRQYTKDFYKKIIDQFRNAHPNMAFSSDFIVGYPGETDEDFEETYRLVEEIQFAQAYSFKYSPRPGTPAALSPQIPEEVKDERLYRLQNLLNQQRDQFNAQCMDKVFSVLLEEKSQDQWYGRTPFMQKVVCDSQEELSQGMVISVKIEKTFRNSLQGVQVLS